MRKLLFLLFLIPLHAWGQGAFLQLSQPLPNATIRVCPVPSGGNPCPSPSSLFLDQALSLPVSNPLTTGPDGNIGVWVSPGQYTIQVSKPYNLVFVVSLGGGGGGGGGTPCTVTNNSLQYNNGGTFGCIPDFLFSAIGHSITAGASAIFDLSASPVLTGFKIPTAVGASPTVSGNLAFNTTNGSPVWGNSGATNTTPQNTTSLTSQWFNSYNPVTGAFGRSQPNFTDLLGTLNISQTPLTNQGDLLTVNATPALVRLAIGANGTCLGSNGTSVAWVGCGGGTINNSSQFSAAYYSAAGSNNVISGVPAPTNPNNVIQFLTSLNSGGSAVAPVFSLAGLTGRLVSTCPDSIAITDRAAWVTYASASACAVALPQAGSAGFSSSFVFGIKNTGAGAVTITPTTSTIDGNTTLVISQGQNCSITSYDNVNYTSRCASGIITAGSGIQITPNANGLQIVNTQSGGTVTSIATTSPISGGPITTTGTISCPTCAIGPGSSTSGDIAAFNGIGGLILQDSGILSSNLVTAAAAYTNGDLVQAAGANKTTSDSGIPSANVVTATSNYTASGDLVQAAGANKTTSDSGLAAANVVTASSAAVSSKQVCTSSGASKSCSYIDFPDTKYIPAANCNNTTGGNGWSIGSGGTVACRAGTQNVGGYISITDTAATFAQFAVAIPEDWDSATNPYIRLQIASADATSGHTIIPLIKTSCSKGDGSTTDDVAYNSPHTLSTITLNTTANQFWSTSNVQMNAGDVTGCVAGGMMLIQVGRSTDTATDGKFYGATITFPRLITVQAN